MNVLIRAYVKLLDRFRFLVVALVVIITAVAIAGLPRLRYNNNLRDLFSSNRAVAETRAAGETEGQRSTADNILMVLLEGDDLFIGDGLQRMYDLTKALKATDGIDDVVSVLDARKQKRLGRILLPLFLRPSSSINRQKSSVEWALEHPMLKDQMIAENGNATLLVVKLEDRDLDLEENRELTALLQETIDGVIAESGTTAAIIGPPVVNTAVSDATMRDQLVFTIAAPIVALLLAIFLFRRPSVVLVVIAAPMLSVIWTLGMLAWCGVERNLVNGVLTPLVVTIGLSQSVHFLFCLRNFLGTAPSPREAWKPTLLDIGPMFILTTATTMIGMGSLAVAELAVIRQFGIFSAIAVLLTTIAVITVIPLLSMTRLGNSLEAPHTKSPNRKDPWAWVYRDYRRVLEGMLRHRWISFATCLALTLGAAAVASQLAVDIRLNYGLPSDSPVLAATARTDELFGGTLPIQIEIQWTPEEDSKGEEALPAIRAIHEVMSDQAIVSPPISLVNVLRSLPGKDEDTLEDRWKDLRLLPKPILAEFFDADAGRAIVMARCQDAGSQAIEKLFIDLESAIAQTCEEHPEMSITITETDIFSLREANRLAHDLIRSLAVAIAITVTLLVLVLKSVRLGMIAVLPNVFPLAATAALMVAYGQPLSLTGTAIFSICLGIAVDDSIHALFNFKRAQEAGATRDEALVDVFVKLGRAMITTTVIMIFGAAVVMLSQVFTLKLFGVLFCISLALALVGDLLVLPSMLAVFSRRSGASNAASDQEVDPAAAGDA